MGSFQVARGIAPHSSGWPGWQKLHHVVAVLSGTRGLLNHRNKERESKEWHTGIFCPSLEVTHHFCLYLWAQNLSHDPTNMQDWIQRLTSTTISAMITLSPLILSTVSSLELPVFYLSFHICDNLTFWDCTRAGIANPRCHFLFPCPADIAHWSWHSLLLSLDTASESFPMQVAASSSVSSPEVKLAVPCLRNFTDPKDV